MINIFHCIDQFTKWPQEQENLIRMNSIFLAAKNLEGAHCQ